jgi:voltage-gated potassium channel
VEVFAYLADTTWLLLRPAVAGEAWLLLCHDCLLRRRAMVQPSAPVRKPPHENGHIPDEIMDGVVETDQSVNVKDPRSPGLKGLVEDALLRPETRAYGLTVRALLVAILGGVVVMALETVHPLVDDFHDLFFAIDMILLAVFTLEYLGSLWVLPDKRKYVLSPWGLVDLAAIAPTYIELVLGGAAGGSFLRLLRTLRVMRTLRVLKLLKIAADQAAKSAEGASQRRNTFAADLQIYAICLFTVVSISSSLIHLAEGVGPTVPETTSEIFSALKDADDGKAPAPDWAEDPMVKLYVERSGKGWSTPVYVYTSVPKAYWWSVVTLTTTGYGDMFPVTGAGRIVAGATMLAGLALFSLLTSVVGRALMTSLFGRDEKDGAKADLKVFVVGSKLPVGFDVHALLGIHTPTAPAVVGGDASPRRVEMGILERPFLEGDFHIEDVAASASSMAGRVVSATTEEEQDTSGLILRPDSNWFDRLVHAGFVDHGSRLYGPVHNGLTFLIFSSVVLVVADSVQWINSAYASYIEAIEFVIVLLFTVEFAANLRMAPRKWNYVLSVWGLIDVLAILPTYFTLAVGFLQFIGIPITIGTGLLFKVMRMLRVLRMLRTLKLAKTAAANMQKTLSGGGSSFWSDLQIYLIALFTILTIASTLIWNVEFDPLNEESTTMFVDIPTSMWWGIVTLCTVGYGDMFPQTLVGRVIGGATMLAGLALFGILTSVIGRALMSSLFGSEEDDENIASPEVVYVDHPVDGATGGLAHLEALRSLGAVSDDEYEVMRTRVVNAT